MTPYLLNLASDTNPWATDGFKRTGAVETYEGPHLVFKEGLVDRRLCAAFSPLACSFRDTVTGIYALQDDSKLLKALTVYLRSSVAAYLLFLTSGWGIDRRRVKKGEVLALPATVLERKEAVVQLAGLLDAYAEGEAPQDRALLIRQMDEAVYQVFELSAAERHMVEDVFAGTVSYVHDGPGSPALARPSAAELHAYAGAFVSVLDQILAATGRSLSARVHAGDSPLLVVSFHIEERQSGESSITVADGERLAPVLASLDRSLWRREGINLYRRRHLRIFEDRTVHVVKPAEKRFWSHSAAFSDADETLAQILASEPHAGR